MLYRCDCSNIPLDPNEPVDDTETGSVGVATAVIAVILLIGILVYLLCRKPLCVEQRRKLGIWKAAKIASRDPAARVRAEFCTPPRRTGPGAPSNPGYPIDAVAIVIEGENGPTPEQTLDETVVVPSAPPLDGPSNARQPRVYPDLAEMAVENKKPWWLRLLPSPPTDEPSDEAVSLRLLPSPPTHEPSDETFSAEGLGPTVEDDAEEVAVVEEREPADEVVAEEVAGVEEREPADEVVTAKGDGDRRAESLNDRPELRIQMPEVEAAEEVAGEVAPQVNSEEGTCSAEGPKERAPETSNDEAGLRFDGPDDAEVPEEGTWGSPQLQNNRGNDLSVIFEGEEDRSTTLEWEDLNLELVSSTLINPQPVVIPSNEDPMMTDSMDSILSQGALARTREAGKRFATLRNKVPPPPPSRIRSFCGRIHDVEDATCDLCSRIDALSRREERLAAGLTGEGLSDINLSRGSSVLSQRVHLRDLSNERETSLEETFYEAQTIVDLLDSTLGLVELENINSTLTDDLNRISALAMNPEVQDIRRLDFTELERSLEDPAPK